MKKLLKRMLKLEYGESAYVFALFGRRFSKPSARVAMRSIRKQER
jgi:hypothetical protein